MIKKDYLVKKNVEYLDLIEAQLKENERLNNNNQAMQEEMARTWEKLDKTNNIINELDTFLKNKIDNFNKDVKDTILHEQMAIRVIYDYLQIVKGDSSNE